MGRMRCLVVVLGFLAVVPGMWGQAPVVKANRVLAILSVKPGVDRKDMAKVMPEEVKETVQLYLDGKIEQWYGRGDGKGVVFILNCSTVEEAKALTGGLPLDKGGYVEFSYMPLGPLAPLHWLLGDAPGQVAK
jgi:hypothetical protein